MSRSARELIPAAIDRFTARLHAVGDERWGAPTPCSEWTVRDLVNHVTYEHTWAPHLLAGETMEQVGDRYEGDLLGDDPVGAWDGAAAVSRPAWEALDSDDTPVHLSFGEAPVSEYAEQMLVDLTVHEWDLARGAGLDERLDPACVDRNLAYARRQLVNFSGSGLFADPVETDSDDPQDQLVALLGRRP